MMPGVPVVPQGAAPEGEKLPKPKTDGKPQTAAPNKAKLIVELPADAKLYVDDQAMKATSPVRSFSTPTLEPGQVYYYELRAEVVRDGKPVSQTKRVLVRAGEVVRAQFAGMPEPEPPITTAQAR
jgi:uncharacterized protein (TIGR03000 family)